MLLLLLLCSLVGGKLEEGWRVVSQRECQDEEEYMCRQLAPSGRFKGVVCVFCSSWWALDIVLIKYTAFSKF